MPPLTKETWSGRLAELELPNHFAKPLREAWDAWGGDERGTLDAYLDVLTYARIPLAKTPLLKDWRDPTNPLGSLLEAFRGAWVFEQAQLGPACVAAAQMFHESGLNGDNRTPLGQKATKADMAAGTYLELPTWECLPLADVVNLEAQGKVMFRHRSTADGRLVVRCLQLFHYAPGLGDDMARLGDYYKRHYEKYRKPRWAPSWSPREFLERVTQAAPSYAATDGDYVGDVLRYVTKYRLDELGSTA